MDHVHSPFPLNSWISSCAAHVNEQGGSVKHTLLQSYKLMGRQLNVRTKALKTGCRKSYLIAANVPEDNCAFNTVKFVEGICNSVCQEAPLQKKRGMCKILVRGSIKHSKKLQKCYASSEMGHHLVVWANVSKEDERVDSQCYAKTCPFPGTDSNVPPWNS